MFIVPALRGFHSGEGKENKKVPFKQGAKGPEEVPATQLFFSPHHPHPDCCTHEGGLVE